jgi:hypothetical protein
MTRKNPIRFNQEAVGDRWIYRATFSCNRLLFATAKK